MHRYFLLFFSLFLGIIWPLSGSTEPIYFPEILNISADSTQKVLLVDKEKQQMYIVQSSMPQSQQVLETYRITTGRNNGDKEKEGDLKTPEGIYNIIDVLPGETLQPKYGPLAFVLNYPNFVDRQFGRTGSGIWIHGRDEEIRDYLTEGCVSLNNQNLLDLQPQITLHHTPVVIEDSITTLNKTEYTEHANSWAGRLDTWARAWEQGNLEAYFNSYSKLFKNGNADIEDFKRRKRYLESVYDWKEVNTGDVLILHTRRETDIIFTQEYYCPNFYSVGTKTLTLIPEEEEWKIISEDYTNTTPVLWKEKFLSDFVNTWTDQWESRDFQKYIALYDSSFRTSDYNYQEWYTYRREILSDTRNISVRVSDLAFRSTGDKEWEISFNQEYSAADYSDYGRKTLRVKGYPDSLRIISENWRPLSRAN